MNRFSKLKFGYTNKFGYKIAVKYTDKEQSMYNFLINRMGNILSQFAGIDINISFVEFYSDDEFGFGINWRDVYNIDTVIFDPSFDPLEEKDEWLDEEEIEFKNRDYKGYILEKKVNAVGNDDGTFISRIESLFTSYDANNENVNKLKDIVSSELGFKVNLEFESQKTKRKMIGKDIVEEFVIVSSRINSYELV